MNYHKGNWRGPKTDYLEKISIEYADRFGFWPDGYEDFCVNGLPYDAYVFLIEACLKTGLDIEELLPLDEYPELWVVR